MSKDKTYFSFSKLFQREGIKYDYTHFGVIKFNPKWLDKNYKYTHNILDGYPNKYIVLGVDAKECFFASEKCPDGLVYYNLDIYRPSPDQNPKLFKSLRDHLSHRLMKGFGHKTIGNLLYYKHKNTQHTHIGYIALEYTKELIEQFENGGEGDFWIGVNAKKYPSANAVTLSLNTYWKDYSDYFKRDKN
jgi:hypothetical protein